MLPTASLLLHSACGWGFLIHLLFLLKASKPFFPPDFLCLLALKLYFARDNLPICALLFYQITKYEAMAMPTNFPRVDNIQPPSLFNVPGAPPGLNERWTNNEGPFPAADPANPWPAVLQQHITAYANGNQTASTTNQVTNPNGCSNLCK